LCRALKSWPSRQLLSARNAVSYRIISYRIVFEFGVITPIRENAYSRAHGLNRFDPLNVNSVADTHSVKNTSFDVLNVTIGSSTTGEGPRDALCQLKCYIAVELYVKSH